MNGRIVVMIAGGVILASAFVKSHPDMIANPPESTREACSALVDPGYCQVASTFNDLRQNRLPRRISTPPLPDHKRTPGAIDPAITQANLAATICNSEDEAEKSPPPSWKAAATRRLANSFYPDQNPDDFALDFLVPISLGGAQADPRNLWLQSWTGFDRERKDRLEMLLNRMVCSGQLPLSIAQQSIARDWIDTYRRAVTPQNLARYGLPIQWAELPVPSFGRIEPGPQPIQNPQGPVILQAEIAPQGQSYEVPEIPVN